MPHAVWLAVGLKARTPAIDRPPFRVVRLSEAPLTAGVETHLGPLRVRPLVPIRCAKCAWSFHFSGKRRTASIVKSRSSSATETRNALLIRSTIVRLGTFVPRSRSLV